MFINLAKFGGRQTFKKQNGGGLCQISGAIFIWRCFLQLEIVERHQHSVDIYTEKTAIHH